MAFFICKAALIFSVLVAISLASHEEKYRFGRSYTINPGKVLFCPSARAGPPGPPGPPGLPGRDGRDGRDCPPCNCAGGSSATLPPAEPPCAGSQPFAPQGPPTGGESSHVHLAAATRDLADETEQSGSGKGGA